MTILKKILFIALPAFTVGAVIIAVFGRGVAAKISGFDENFYLKYYYSLTNRAKHKTQDAREAITIFDISKYQSRTDIARIIDSLVAYSPKVIGIDVFFINNPDINDSINNSLIKSLRKAQGTLVVPYIEKHTSLLDNYDIQLLSGIPQDNTCFGIYNYKVKFKDSPEKEKMPVTIAKKYLGKENFPDEDILINYVSKDFLCISDIDEISFYKDKIKDGVVLIGDVYDIKDIKDFPFSIAQIGNASAVSSTLPGIGNIAYIVNTLISINTSGDAESYSPKANAPLKYLPYWFNILISFILTAIYLFLYDRLCKFGSKESKLSKYFFIIAKPILLIFYMIIVTALAFCITSTINYIPDLLLFLSGSFLIETSYDLYTLKTK